MSLLNHYKKMILPALQAQADGHHPVRHSNEFANIKIPPYAMS